MRNCEVCGKSQRRKKVQSTFGRRVICLACGTKWMFDDTGKVVPRRSDILDLAFSNAAMHIRDTDHRDQRREADGDVLWA